MKFKKLIFLALATTVFAESGTLTKVVDGDTVYFSNGNKCRLAYIDTPESSFNAKAKRDASKCEGVTVGAIVDAGKASSSMLKSIVKIGKSYQYDVVDIDKYGRSVCIIKNDTHGTLNEEMVSSGFAVPFSRYILNRNDQQLYFNALRSAKRTNAGIWSRNHPVMQCMEKIDQ